MPEIAAGIHLESKCPGPWSGLKAFPNEKGEFNCGYVKLLTQEPKKKFPWGFKVRRERPEDCYTCHQK